MKKKSKYATGGTTSKPTTIQQKVADRNRRMAEAMGDVPKPPPRPKPFASGGSVKAPAKPMTLAERVADRNRRMAEAMGDAPTPTPKPATPKKKPDPFANGGQVRPAVMPTPQPRPSNFTVGPLQFGGPGGFGGAGTPTRTPGAPSTNPNYASDRNLPMRDQRDMDNMKQKIKERLGERMGGLRERLKGLGDDADRMRQQGFAQDQMKKMQDIVNRPRPSVPRPVGPGGGYKKGGAVDGCAMRGKTKGIKK